MTSRTPKKKTAAPRKAAAAAPAPPAVPRLRVPPIPGRAQMPPPPSFGWVGDPDDLTHSEIDEMIRDSGHKLQDMKGPMLLAYAAVAYARRENRDLYPWAVASMLRYDEVQTGVIDQELSEAEIQALADAQEKAIEAGEDAPDPA